MPVVSSCTIIKRVDISDKISQYTLKLSKTSFYEPGQFLQLTLDTVSASDYWPSSRAFSIASFTDPLSDELEIVVKSSGGYTSLINENLSIGSTCTIKYPYGDFILPEIQPSSKYVGLCNGVGITPFLAMIDYLKSLGKLAQFDLHYSLKYLDECIGLDKLQSSLKSNLTLYVTREQTDAYVNRRINRADFEGKYDQKETVFYISGSQDFIEEMKTMLENCSFENIFIDSWV